MLVIAAPSSEPIPAVLAQLLDYCQARNWAGADPYDALNSEWLHCFPSLNHRIQRLFLTQCLKRSPVNLRPLLRIPPTQNPKALALFLSAFIKMKRMGMLATRSLIDEMLERLQSQRSPGTPHAGWGYSFPWQTRTELVPRGAPNLVCTVFVANALLDAYEALKNPMHLELAADAAYSVQQLYWTDAEGRSGFSYPSPSSHAGVHNANFLGAALLCRISRLCDEPQWAKTGIAAARYSAGKQKNNGAWAYSDLDTQQWIDHFHTGYNLCALRTIGSDAQTDEFEPCLQRGFHFYRTRFFREDGAPKYFHNRTYPIDTHSVAQSLITLSKLKDMDCGNTPLARSVLDWALQNLWDKRGYFYYRVHPFLKIRTSYMRWSQAWMLLALATVAENSNPPRRPSP